MSNNYNWKELEYDVDAVLEQHQENRAIIDAVRPLLQRLLANDDLIPEAYQAPLPNKYAQYLLYKPENESFSVIAFIWGPGQTAPVHDHLVWGLVGLYRGSVIEKRYRREDHGRLADPRYSIREVSEVTAKQGDITFVYPPDYDIHGVSNPFAEQAITVHIYGTDIGKQERHIHDVETGKSRDVITRHDNESPIYS
ncbi:cysteine dioxygenase family protein [Paenibacillus agricola]|uniref:Cysteine dioxygenase n=1 Tax=Paenibacillus agricola TaxID=2716264 RepID=A0ABX0IZ39_9BACL|nr:cysteine dioxygenase [Paenibacillus agricola]NHN29147.1 cysteine dioxygenase [Paenibacillus agricola]